MNVVKRLASRKQKAAAPKPPAPQRKDGSTAGPAVEERFERIRQLGRGSYGVVWLVRRKADDQLLAMKTVLLPPLASKEDKALDARRQALREVEVLQSLQSPHIVRYAEMFLTPPSADSSQSELHILTEFCDGGDLHSYLRCRKGEVIEVDAWRFSTAVLQGLHELHSRKILHRDLKPANIFLKRSRKGPELRALLGDLGLARTISDSQPLASTMVGTPHYCAPEIFEGVPYGEKADIYSFGVCVYEIMHGRTPHADVNNIAGLVRRVLRLDLGGSNSQSALEPQFDARFSTPLRALVQSCLETSPMARPSTDELLLQVPAEHLAAAAAAADALSTEKKEMPSNAIRQNSSNRSSRSSAAKSPFPFQPCSRVASPSASGAPIDTSTKAEAERTLEPILKASCGDSMTQQEKRKEDEVDPAMAEETLLKLPAESTAINDKTKHHPKLAEEDLFTAAVPEDVKTSCPTTMPSPQKEATAVLESISMSLASSSDSKDQREKTMQEPSCQSAEAPPAAMESCEQPRPGSAGSQLPVKRSSGNLMGYVARAQECWSRWRREGRGFLPSPPGSPPLLGHARGVFRPAKPGPTREVFEGLEVLGKAKIRTPRPASRV